MKIFEKPNYNSDLSLALGFFDGVHLAHQNLIKKTVELAKNEGIKSAVITFKNNPLCDLRGIGANYIYNNEKKCKYIEALGVDFVYLLDFKDFIDMSADEYLQNVLIKFFKPKFITTGFNHHFGKNKSGGADFLEKNETQYGYKYNKIEPIEINGTLVSTTNIKKMLSKGNLEDANLFLKRKFSVNGDVIEGNKIGTKIGFPTANLLWQENIYKLPRGVYSGSCLGKKSLINWGLRPTVGGEKDILEVHISDFDKNIYGKNITVHFDRKIRNEIKFKNLDELKSQIQKDLSS